MNAPTKVGAYAVGLVAAFGIAVGVGAAVGPLGPASAESEHGAGGAGGHAPSSMASGGEPASSAQETAQETDDEIPGGMMVSQAGYTLALSRDALAPGAAVPLAFRVLGPDGKPVTRYERSHDKDLHLIAVRRDLTGFQHVHPTLAPDGTWSAPVDLTPGDWRVFADFTAAGHAEGLTLGADLAVAGAYAPRPLPAPAATTVVDGYTVTLDGRMQPGRESELTFSVSKDGRPVTDLQPYLGAYGHLVVLRDGDLAYLHVHPAGEPEDGATRPGPGITFHGTAPSVGDYRMFLDFRHAGVVRTAEFTVRADPTADVSPEPPTHGSDGHGH